MRKKFLCLDLFTEQEAIQKLSLSSKEPDLEYQKILHALTNATKGELTHRQLQCVELYYYRGLTARQTGELLGINESTVCRHLKKARNRLKTVLGYSFSRLN